MLVRRLLDYRRKHLMHMHAVYKANRKPMMVRAFGMVGVLAASLACVWPMSAAVAEPSIQRLAIEKRPTSVAAYSGHVVWSRWRPSVRRYRLVQYTSAGIRTLPVDGRRVPFDVDLGPNARGGISAVYSRCVTEPRLMDWQTELPAYYQARGCRLYEYDLGRRRERRLPRLAITGSSQFLPSLWKGAIAFAARRDSRRAEIMLRRASLRSGRSLPVPRGPRGTDTSVDDSALLAIDMRGTRVTYAWESFRDECPQPPEDSGDVDGIRVDLISVGQRRSILKTTCNYLRPGLVGAPQYPGAVATVQEDFAGPGVWSGTVKRFPSSSSDPMLGAPDNVISFALDGSSTAIFASHPVDGSDVAITRTGG